MTPVQQLLPRGLADVIRKAPLTPEKVAFAWRLAVGPAIARATVVELADGVLHVRARTGSWGRELRRSTRAIEARLADLLGEGTVSSLAVTAAEPDRPRMPRG